MRLKKNTICCLLFCCMLNPAMSKSAPKFLPGIKVGFNFTKSHAISDEEQIGYPGYPKYYSPAALQIGVFYELQFSNNLSLVHELIYLKTMQIGNYFDFTETPISDEIESYYLQMPVLIKLKTAKGLLPYMTTGPVIGFLQEAFYKSSDNRVRYHLVDVLTKNDVQWTIGLGKQVKKGNFELFAEIRYLHGFTAYELNELLVFTRWRTRSIQLNF